MDLLRRRNMMQGMGNISPYPDPWVDDGKVWVYYNVTTTESATRILGNISSMRAMSIDGGDEVTPTTTYQFGTTGEHLIKYTLSNSSIFGGTSGDNSPFRYATTAKRIYMPDTVTSVGASSAYQNTGIVFIRFSQNISSIGNNAFSGCSNLVIDDLSLPNLTTLGTNAMYGTKVVRISDLGALTEIGSNAFQSCKQLTDVDLPATLNSLLANAFSQCSALKRIVCHAVTPPSVANYVFSSVSPTSVKVPAESVEAYKAASGWSSFASKIQAIPT